MRFAVEIWGLIIYLWIFYIFYYCSFFTHSLLIALLIIYPAFSISRLFLSFIKPCYYKILYIYYIFHHHTSLTLPKMRFFLAFQWMKNISIVCWVFYMRQNTQLFGNIYDIYFDDLFEAWSGSMFINSVQTTP